MFSFVMTDPLFFLKCLYIFLILLLHELWGFSITISSLILSIRYLRLLHFIMIIHIDVSTMISALTHVCKILNIKFTRFSNHASLLLLSADTTLGVDDAVIDVVLVNEVAHVEVTFPQERLVAHYPWIVTLLWILLNLRLMIIFEMILHINHLFINSRISINSLAGFFIY